MICPQMASTNSSKTFFSFLSFISISSTFNYSCLLDFYSDLRSTVNTFAARSDVRTTAGTDSSDLADTSGFALGIKLCFHICSRNVLQK